VYTCLVIEFDYGDHSSILILDISSAREHETHYVELVETVIEEQVAVVLCEEHIGD